MGWLNVNYTKDDLSQIEKELDCWKYIINHAISDEEIDIAHDKIEILKDAIRNLTK